jgi:lipoprotein Spr
MRHIKIITSVLLFSAAALLSSNASAFMLPSELASAAWQHPPGTALSTPTVPKTETAHDDQERHVRSVLLAQYSGWKGTHYLWGGTGHDGVDCSSLVQHIFGDSLHRRLPRTTFQQKEEGREISKIRLKPGDLVFFRTTPGFRHVGIYIGGHQFIHASKSQGVTISSLDNQYWVSHYETARRLLLIS